MSRIEVPAWVTQSFVRSASAVGATSSRAQIEQACAEFIELWSTPERRFHDTRHLFDLLTRVDRLAPEAHNADVVRLAAWGHGCMFSTRDQVAYTRNGGEDRAESARVSSEIFRGLGIPDAVVEQVSNLIAGMRQHAVPVQDNGVFEAEDMDLHVLADAHLGFLANQPQKYRTYMATVREEYAHIPARDFVAARLEIVTRLLQRKRLFATPLAADWEDAARQNLESEKARLTAELKPDQPAGEPAQPAEALAPEADDAERVSRPNVAPSQAVYGGSSLEEPSADLEPGSPTKVLTPEEAKQARRDDVARASRERTERAREKATGRAPDNEGRDTEDPDSQDLSIENTTYEATAPDAAPKADEDDDFPSGLVD